MSGNTKYINVDTRIYRKKTVNNEGDARKEIMGMYKDVPGYVDIYPNKSTTDYKINGKRIGVYDNEKGKLFVKKTPPLLKQKRKSKPKNSDDPFGLGKLLNYKLW